MRQGFRVFVDVREAIHGSQVRRVYAETVPADVVDNGLCWHRIASDPHGDPVGNEQ
jgi:hypothetical protein